MIFYDAGDVLVATTYTDGDTGNYCFEDIPGAEYVVVETQPSNYNSISDYDHTTGVFDPDGLAGINDPDNMIPSTLVPGELDMDNDFIENPFLGSISGHVSDDAGTSLSNVTIQLYYDTNMDGLPDGASIATTLTDASGNYIFGGATPGYYVVVETNPFYYGNISDYDHTTAPPDTDGDDSAQGPDDNIPVTLLPAEADADNNFIDGRPGTICGSVHDDTGLPISGVQIRLYLDVNNNDSLDAADILVLTTLTDGDTGNYCFEDVTPGEYVVVETQPPFYFSVSDYDHTTNASDPDGLASGNDPDNEIPVTLLPAEQDMDNDFIEDPFNGSITGHVHDEIGTPLVGVVITLFHDTNADGVQDGTGFATASTDGTGFFIFTGVEPGFYVIVETSPLYYSNISDYDHTTAPPDTDGNDSAQGPDDNIPVKIVPAEIDADNDFVDGRPGNICGRVTDDTGLYIASVQIRLYSGCK
jgi:protocatechuate 3,4-dioxygenase beta subunit